MDEEEVEELDYQGEVNEIIQELEDANTEARMAEQRFHRTIVRAKDDAGFTFREISSVTGIAHSWIYKLYKREKNQARQDGRRVRR